MLIRLTLIAVTLLLVLVMAACQSSPSPTTPAALTSTPNPTGDATESLALPRKVIPQMLSYEQLTQWADWFAWELTLPPDGPMVRMEHDFSATLASCDRAFTETQAARAKTENNHFSLLPYSYKWKSSTVGLQDVDFWQTLSDPNISASDWIEVQDIVGDFVWRYQTSVTRLIMLYEGIGCEDTVDLLQELLYPHYNDLPLS